MRASLSCSCAFCCNFIFSILLSWVNFGGSILRRLRRFLQCLCFLLFWFCKASTSNLLAPSHSPNSFLSLRVSLFFASLFSISSRCSSKFVGNLLSIPCKNSHPSSPFPPHPLLNTTSRSARVSEAMSQTARWTSLSLLSRSKNFQQRPSMNASREEQEYSTQPIRYCPSLTPAFRIGELALTYTTGKYVQKAQSNRSLLTLMPIRSFSPPHLLLGVTSIVRTLRYLVLTIFICTLLSTFSFSTCRGDLGIPLLQGPANLSRIYAGDFSIGGGITSTIKSKNRSTLPSKGLLGLIEIMRQPQPFCRSLDVLVFPINSIITLLASNPFINHHQDMK